MVTVSLTRRVGIINLAIITGPAATMDRIVRTDDAGGLVNDVRQKYDYSASTGGFLHTIGAEGEIRGSVVVVRQKRSAPGGRGGGGHVHRFAVWFSAGVWETGL